MKKKLLSFLPNWEAITKLITIMKISIVLLLICTFSVSASVQLQAQKLTLTMENATMRQVFNEIEKKTGLTFFYVDEQVDVNRTVSLALNDKPVEEVLDQLFDKTQLKYKVFDNKLVVLSPSVVQQHKITGKVTDATTGESLPGVNIIVEGTTVGVVSDINGKYSIDLPDEKATLVFSYVGYNPERISIEGRTTIDVNMVPDVKSLDEVVVVGYGTMKKRNVTSAVTAFKADNLNERPISRVDQALVGQMAGVEVKQTTGTVGKAFSISVRGTGSLSAGTEPLYVVDGFPLAISKPNSSGNFDRGNPLDNINTNDIESIQVLKDAAAAAIYGSRAANGVVLITTKRGKTGKPKISLDVYSGYSQATRKVDMLSAEEWVDRSIEMINAQWAHDQGGTADQTTDQRRTILGLAPGAYNTKYMIDDRWNMPGHPGLNYIDWQDQILRKGKVQNYQLSASGGTESVKYYVSGNYAKQEGIVLGMDYTTFSARANVEVSANKNLKFGINLTPTYSVTNDPGVEGKDQIWHQSLSFSPVQEDTMGLYVNTGDFGLYKWSNTNNSPVSKLLNNIGQTKRFRTLTSIYAEYQIVKGLNFKTTVNLDNLDNTTKNYAPYTNVGTLASRQASNNVLSTGSLSGYKKQTFVNENTLAYNATFHEKHNISLLAGASYNQDYLNTSQLNAPTGFNTSGVTTLNESSTQTGNSTESKNVLLSYFGRLQYDFDGKYLVSASIRRDGSSRFGANSKWATFPSASLGWRVSNENFMKQIKLISDLKLRFSWGTAGNYNIGDYSSIEQLSTYDYTAGTGATGVKLIGRAVNASVNPDLTWEESSTIDFGAEIGVFDNRITGSFDYYNKLNTGLLLNVPIPGVTGFNTTLSNVGKVRNKGWEIELTTHNLTGQFNWTTTANLTHNTNKVEALGPGQTQIQIPSSFDIAHSIDSIGQPINSIYVVRQIGILSQADIDNKVPVFTGSGPEFAGDPKYFDANGDGVIDANDRVIVGHPTPDYVWGITNMVKYKGFDLSILVQGQQGGSIYSLLGRALGRTGQTNVDNYLGIGRDRWRSADDPGNGTTPKAYSLFGRIVNTDWLYSSDYWRIRNITLGYDLGKLIKIKQIEGARIYISAENWFGKDKYFGGANPEAVNTDVSGSSTFPEAGDYGGLPLAKSLIIGLNLTF